MEEISKEKKLAEIRIEMEKDHNKKKEEIKIRRNIKIKKIICSIVIISVVYILLINIKWIKAFIDKNIIFPDIVTGVVSLIISSIIMFSFKKLSNKIKNRK